LGIIRIQDLPVEVRIGALPEERVSTQTVRVDIEIRAEMQGAVATDSLDATVNYIDVVNAARLAIEGTTCYLVETVAGRVLEAVSSFPGVQWARVRVRKVHLPGMGEVGFVEVEEEKSLG